MTYRLLCVGLASLALSGCSILYPFDDLERPSARQDAGGQHTDAAQPAPDAAAPEPADAAAQPPDAAQPMPQLTITPSQPDFGLVLVDAKSSARKLTVKNAGTVAAAEVTLALTGDAAHFEKDRDSCGALLPQASCEVTVTFAPTASGAFTATLTASDVSGATGTATLTGSGYRPATLTLSPSQADFGAAAQGTQGQSREFTLENAGDVESDTVQTLLEGVDAASFAFGANPCGGAKLGARATCKFTVRHQPLLAGAAGGQVATLTVQASPAGGKAQAGLTATALVPAKIEVSGPSDFGAALVGTAVTKSYTATNTGEAPTGPLAIAFTGTHFADFQQVLPVEAGECDFGVTTLAEKASCTFRTVFTPDGRGARAATLTVSASPGDSAWVSLGGTGQLPATLQAVGSATHGFGNQELGTASQPFVWKILNGGDFATTVPQVGLSGAGKADFTAAGCDAVLAAGASCDVSVTFSPTLAGARAAKVTLAAATGGTATLDVTGTGQSRVSVTLEGTGSVTSADGAINCGSVNLCSALYQGGTVTLTASNENGSGYVFDRWSGACAGQQRQCSVDATASRSVTAVFRVIDHNLVFVTSQTYSAGLGSLSAYDAECNALATAAGINNVTDNAFVAFMSTTGVNARDRLGSAQGFERVDGKPVGTTLDSLLHPNWKVLHDISIDENGARIPPGSWTLTGTGSLGEAVACCEGWKAGSQAMYSFGIPEGGPAYWVATNIGSCDIPGRLYCFMKTFTTPMVVETATGKRIWTAATPYPITDGTGVPTPLTKCNQEKPAGVASAKALLGYVATPAAAALDLTAQYVRPDGQVVGLGSEIAAGKLRTGIWQLSDGVYYPKPVWTGYADSNLLTDTAPPRTTCDEWKETTAWGNGGPLGRGGDSGFTSQAWWHNIDNAECWDQGYHLYCVEE